MLKRVIRIKTYTTNNYKSHIGYVENNLYKKHKIVEHSITQITHINMITNIQLMCLMPIR